MSTRLTDIPSPEQRLDSWKSIAQHLGRSCRTIQRWHAEYGLPIYRLGGNKGPIFAYANELDDWMRYRGRAATGESPEMGEPVLLLPTPLHAESIHRNEAFDFSLVTGADRAHSAELVDLGYKMWETLSHRNLSTITRLFREAIDFDPGNAAGFAGFAHAMVAQGLWGLVNAPVAYASAEAALQKALEINSELIQAKSAAAWLNLVLYRDWQGAIRSFDEILSQRPLSTRCLVGRAMIHIATGTLNDASGLLLKAAEKNALSASAAALYCWCEYLAGNFARALDQIDQVRASGRSGPIVDAAEALVSIQLEEPDAQIKRIEALAADSPRHDVLRGALGYVYAVTGQGERASELLDSMTNPRLHSTNREPYAVALILLGLNQTQEAVKWLEQSYREGSLWSFGFRSDPILAQLCNDPYYRQFLSKASYPVPENADPRKEIAD